MANRHVITTTKQWHTLLVICAALLVLVFWMGRASRDVDACIHCAAWDGQPTALVECEPQRCPMGPVLWSDVFKSPDEGGFTVSVPEGSWRVDWRMNGMPDRCGVCGATGVLPCDDCAHDANLCPRGGR